MEGWKYWMDKKVFIILKSKRQYSGIVIEVSDENNGVAWISIIDKYNKKITFVNSEIDLIQEEEND